MPKLLFDRAEHPDVTYDDVFLVPNNDVYARVTERCSTEEKTSLDKARSCMQLAEKHLGMNSRKGEHAAEYRNVLLSLAEKYGIGGPISRDAIDLTPAGGLSQTPIIVSNMKAVTGKRMAEAIARVGGIAAVHQDKNDEEMQQIISYLRNAHPVYDTPVKVSMYASVRDVRSYIAKRSHGMAIIENEDGRFVGIVGDADIAQKDPDARVRKFVRTEDVVTASDGISPREAFDAMSVVSYLPILKTDGTVAGVLSKTDAAMRLRYKSNIDERNGGLRALYTVGALNKSPIDRVKFLLDQGVYDILLDTANFDQGIIPFRNAERIMDVAAQRNVQINLMAGNVVTRSAVHNILMTGAKFVKVGVGPGAMCTTRMQTGVGRPQVSAILEAVEEADKYGGYVVADGGIQYPRDVAIALAAGANYVMMGTLFAATHESPGIFGVENGKKYKINYGMASRNAADERNEGKDVQTDGDIFRDFIGHRAEGIDKGYVFVREGMESVALLHHAFLDGPSSSIAYANAASLRKFPKNAVMGIQTGSGFREGTAKEKI